MSCFSLRRSGMAVVLPGSPIGPELPTGITNSGGPKRPPFPTDTSNAIPGPETLGWAGPDAIQQNQEKPPGRGPMRVGNALAFAVIDRPRRRRDPCAAGLEAPARLGPRGPAGAGAGD